MDWVTSFHKIGHISVSTSFNQILRLDNDDVPYATSIAQLLYIITSLGGQYLWDLHLIIRGNDKN